MKVHCLILALVLTHWMPTLLQAADGTPAWTNTFGAADNTTDIPRDMVVDNLGNVYVTGGGNGADSDDWITIKYSSTGVVLWKNYFRGNANLGDASWALALDVERNVYVTGGTLRTQQTVDCVTIKYSNTGLPLWTNYFADAEGRALAVDGVGNVYVGSLAVSNAPGNYYDYVILKYSSSGDCLWTNRFSYGNQDYLMTMAVDRGNSVFVTGTSYLSETLSETKHVTIKYSSGGVALWTNIFAGASNENGLVSLGLDSNGNVFVAGATSDGLGSQFITVKYSNAGEPIWTNVFNGPYGDDFVTSLAVDGNDDVNIVGDTRNPEGRFDYAVIKYSNAGLPLWTNYVHAGRSASSSFKERKTVLTADKNGNVYVSGVQAFAGDPSARCITTKYSNMGVGLWTNQLSVGWGYPWNLCLAVDHLGNVYSAISVRPSFETTDDIVTLKYSGADVIPSLTLQVGIPEVWNNTLTLTGNPNLQYVTQFATNLTGSPWFSFATNTPNGNGTCTVIDSTATNVQRFYRAFVPIP